jgi:hypothetical protein
MRRRILVVLFLVGGCAPDGSPASDGGAGDAAGLSRDLAGDGAPHGDAATGDAATGDDAAAGFDAASGDLAPDLTQPHPPAGATPCGSGSFTTADLKTVCTHGSLILIDSMNQPLPQSCDALTLGSGSFDVWCTPTKAYAFFHFSSLQASGTLTGCLGATYLELVPDYEVTIVGGSMGGSLTSGDLTQGWASVPSDVSVDVNMSIDFYAWLTMDRSSTSASVYLTGLTFALGMCQSKLYSLGGATATWH